MMWPLNTATAPDPVGVIQLYSGATAPTGWMLCDGTAISRTTYSALFAVTSTTYGVGNGTTTFNLPDLRGRAPIGAGTGSGLTARTRGTALGAETVVTDGFSVVGDTSEGSGVAASASIMQPSLVLNFIIKV